MGNDSNENMIVGNNFKAGHTIFKGNFSEIKLGSNIKTGEPVAIKMEPLNSKAPTIVLEDRIYKLIRNVEGFPKIYYCGPEYLVMELLGQNLEDLFYLCNRKFSHKTVIQIAIQMINRLEKLHSKNIIYRDVKPENYVLGRKGTPSVNIIHLLDFGLSKEFINPDNNKHISLREGKPPTGTPRYMSVNVHLGKELSRRDDLESAGYTWIYFMNGKLPWQGIETNNLLERIKQIGIKKRSLPIETLCEGIPEEFATYLRYVRKLDFDETPDYVYLKKLFLELFSLNYHDDGEYDWTHKL